jgi:hypothetical protein
VAAARNATPTSGATPNGNATSTSDLAHVGALHSADSSTPAARVTADSPTTGTATTPQPATTPQTAATPQTTAIPEQAARPEQAANASGLGPPCGVSIADNWVPGFGAKANLVVTIDWRDLQAATADAIGDTVYTGGLSAAMIRRLACDAKVMPLVLGSNSEPLDVGRAERLVTRAMRRALNVRDKGCVVCQAPAVMCDAHHLKSWIDGGITAVSNLVLLCRMHHVDLHAGKWVITIIDGVVRVNRPSWADPPSRPRSGPTPHTRRPASPGRLSTPGQTPRAAAPKPPRPPEPTAAAAQPGARPPATEQTPTPDVSQPGQPERHEPAEPRSRGLLGDRDECQEPGGCGERHEPAEPGDSGQPSVRGEGDVGGGRGGRGGDVVLSEAEVRAATMRAIWGEGLPSEPPPASRFPVRPARTSTPGPTPTRP